MMSCLTTRLRSHAIGSRAVWRDRGESSTFAWDHRRKISERLVESRCYKQKGSRMASRAERIVLGEAAI